METISKEEIKFLPKWEEKLQSAGIRDKVIANCIQQWSFEDLERELDYCNKAESWWGFVARLFWWPFSIEADGDMEKGIDFWVKVAAKNF